MPKRGSVLLYVHRNRKAHYDGEPRTATSTFTQLLNSELQQRTGNLFTASVIPASSRGRGWGGRGHRATGWGGGGGRGREDTDERGQARRASRGLFFIFLHDDHDARQQYMCDNRNDRATVPA